MEQLSKFKTELSKLSGVDFHSPKYREIFKRYFSAVKTDTEDVEDNVETETQSDEIVNEPETETTETVEETEQDENKNAENNGENTESDTQDGEVETDEEMSSQEDNSSQNITEGENTNTTESEEILTKEEASAQSASDVTNELLNTKLELELVRAGIREDRLETAKRLFMPEFKSSGGNVQEIRELVAQYPEWIRQQGGATQGFGMPLGDKADALTNEEKKLKQLGIDPRN